MLDLKDGGFQYSGKQEEANYYYYYHCIILFFTLEIPLIRPAEYKLPIIGEICIFMFSLDIKRKFYKIYQNKLALLPLKGFN